MAESREAVPLTDRCRWECSNGIRRWSSQAGVQSGFAVAAEHTQGILGSGEIRKAPPRQANSIPADGGFCQRGGFQTRHVHLVVEYLASASAPLPNRGIEQRCEFFGLHALAAPFPVWCLWDRCH